MDDPVTGMAAFTAQCITAVTGTGKFAAPLGQLGDHFGCLPNNQPHDILITQSVTGRQCVCDMLLHGIVIADSSGFRWFASDPAEPNAAVMGESLAWTENTRLHALSPLPCRFTIVQDGKVAHQAEGRTIEWSPPQPGKYRVEAELKVLEDWVPWVYANPIQLR